MCSCRSHKSVWYQPRFNNKKSILFMMSTCNRKQKQQCLRLVEVTVTIEMSKSVNVRTELQKPREQKLQWGGAKFTEAILITMQRFTTQAKQKQQSWKTTIITLRKLDVLCCGIWSLQYFVEWTVIQFSLIQFIYTAPNHSTVASTHFILYGKDPTIKQRTPQL